MLTEVEEAVQLWLLTGALAELNRRFSPVDDVVAIWSIKQARDAAWTRAEVLWTLRDQRLVRRNFVKILDRSTGMASRAFLTPVPFVEGAPQLVRQTPA
jgi:hypothetical protein